MSFSELIWREVNADVAQLVARNLAKVQVAGSNPVVRSDFQFFSMVEWPRGEARDCKSLYTGSNPVSTSIINFESGNLTCLIDSR